MIKYHSSWDPADLLDEMDSIDELIGRLEIETEMLKEMKKCGVEVEPCCGCYDGPLHLVTTDPRVAETFFGFGECFDNAHGRNEDTEDWTNGMYPTLSEKANLTEEQEAARIQLAKERLRAAVESAKANERQKASPTFTSQIKR